MEEDQLGIWAVIQREIKALEKNMEKRRWGKVACERKNGNLIECPIRMESEKIPDTSYKEQGSLWEETTADELPGRDIACQAWFLWSQTSNSVSGSHCGGSKGLSVSGKEVSSTSCSVREEWLLHPSCVNRYEDKAFPRTDQRSWQKKELVVLLCVLIISLFIQKK